MQVVVFMLYFIL